MRKLPWVSVNDSLPPANEDVLFWANFGLIDGLPNGLPCLGYKANNDKDDTLWLDKAYRDNDDEPIEVRTVTHWLRITTP